ncbi:hypothetical protein AB205_0133140 [Aquarana catesbeiana]|uniref:Secreted protein n=1 Tax=Aquarana catesbeiana TaxID=8400 RepID=A0A2G9RQR9_AQUCT|nr:hypothetical protein AB205_0133140 [Aquarana catesbeiana]
MLTFFMAFLFNWIGFFLSFCLTTSAAGRYGAISGFGLSLIKWILIVRDSFCFSEDSSITQRFESCQTTFPLSQEPGFFLFIKVVWSLPSCLCKTPEHMDRLHGHLQEETQNFKHRREKKNTCFI